MVYFLQQVSFYNFWVCSELYQSDIKTGYALSCSNFLQVNQVL